MPANDSPAALLQRSRIAWGLAAVCALFLLETWNAHRVTPSPHSPLVWTVLGLLAAGCTAAALWWGHKAKRGRSGS
ncbi:MAG: hypothetical protein Fur0014_07360 [Rubrivivax sp.]